MNTRYLSTTLATDWPLSSANSTSVSHRIVEKILSFIPTANPTYKNKLQYIKRWLIEFEDGHLPAREIGLDTNNIPILHGPTEVDYGFWLDTNMTFKDFNGSPLSKEEFDSFWERAEQGAAANP